VHSALDNSRIATCSEAVNSSKNGTWTARYEWQVGKGSNAPELRIQSAEGAAGTADRNAVWTVHWTPANGVASDVSATGTDLTRLHIDAAVATLLAPDHTCSLVLSANAGTGQVAVIGDSVLGHIESDWAARTPVDSWLVTAESGFGWSASAPTWPLTTVRGSWVMSLLRGFASRAPRCVVVELGANDALRLAFADARHDSRLASAIRSAVAANIGQFVAAAEQLRLPIVIVTAPTYPTSAFGGKAAYQQEAMRLNQLIKAAIPRQRAAIVDWASASAGHHQPSTSTSGWFIADQLHPNPTGEKVLVTLIQEAVARATGSLIPSRA
jgi:lysophospholipase L1-like esterase